MRNQRHRLSPEKIVGYKLPEEELASPERISWQIVERSELIHRALVKAPSEIEAELCMLGYQTCMDTLITLQRLVSEELPKSGLIRRARLRAAQHRATDSLARVRGDLPSDLRVRHREWS